MSINLYTFYIKQIDWVNFKIIVSDDIEKNEFQIKVLFFLKKNFTSLCKKCQPGNTAPASFKCKAKFSAIIEVEQISHRSYKMFFYCPVLNCLKLPHCGIPSSKLSVFIISKPKSNFSRWSSGILSLIDCWRNTIARH